CFGESGFERIGLTGFEPATSWSRTKSDAIEDSEKQVEFGAGTIGLHPRLHHLPDADSASPLAAGLAGLLYNLSEADKLALARVLLAEGSPSDMSPGQPSPLSRQSSGGLTADSIPETR